MDYVKVTYNGCLYGDMDITGMEVMEKNEFYKLYDAVANINEQVYVYYDTVESDEEFFSGEDLLDSNVNAEHISEEDALVFLKTFGKCGFCASDILNNIIGIEDEN